MIDYEWMRNAKMRMLGGMIGAVFPAEQHQPQIDTLRSDIEYGIDMGVPDQG